MAKRRILLAAAFAALLSPAAFAAPVETGAEVVKNAIDDYIRPGYAHLAEAAGVMDAAMETLCAETSPAHLTAARDAFEDVVLAWSGIEYVRFGPVMEENRVERMLFWPDRRGIALRQIQGILAEKDETATDPASLAGKSVAVQGLNALEFVLFGSGAESLGRSEGGFRCRYGSAVAGNIETIAAAVSDGWGASDGIAGRMTAPAPDDPAYRSDTDALQEILGILVDGTEALRDLKLKPPLGENIDDANPNAWIYRRSGLAKPSIAANFDGLETAFTASGIAGLFRPEQQYLKDSVAFEFENAERALGAIQKPLPEAVQDPDGYGRLAYLVIVTQSLQSLFAEQISPALGLSTGFSSLDGD